MGAVIIGTIFSELSLPEVIKVQNVNIVEQKGLEDIWAYPLTLFDYVHHTIMGVANLATGHIFSHQVKMFYKAKKFTLASCLQGISYK